MIDLDKYVTYLQNVERDNPYIKIKDFDEDWDPIGPQLRKDLTDQNVILQEPSEGIMILCNAYAENPVDDLF